MNKRTFLYVWFLGIGLMLTSCATSRNSDDTLDACKLTRPPREAKVEGAGHVGQFVSYPAVIPENYTGCKKIWLTDYDYPVSAFELLGIINFKNGLVSRVEALDFELNDKKLNNEKIVCEFDKNKALISGPSNFCLPYETWKNW